MTDSKHKWSLLVPVFGFWATSFVTGGCKDEKPPPTMTEPLTTGETGQSPDVGKQTAAVDHFERLKPTFPPYLRRMYDDAGEITPRTESGRILHLDLYYTQAPPEGIRSFAATSQGKLPGSDASDAIVHGKVESIKDVEWQGFSDCVVVWIFAKDFPMLLRRYGEGCGEVQSHPEYRLDPVRP